MTEQELFAILFPEKVQAAREAIALLEQVNAKLAEMNQLSESDDLWHDENDLWYEEPAQQAPRGARIL
jgi:hypothetical protein